MHKLWSIAAREYKAAVKTKAFVLSLVLVPVMWGLSIGVQVLIHKAEDHSTKKFAIVDRTADKQITAALETAVYYHNEKKVYDEKKEQTKPKYELIAIVPSAPDSISILQQRYDLSRQCENGDFEGFLDIGPNVYDLPPSSTDGPNDEKRELRYQSAKPGSGGFGYWAEAVANDGILQHRLASHNISLDFVKKYQQQPTALKSKGLTGKDKVTGEIRDATDESRVATFVLPAVLIVLMYFMILVGASPAMQGVVEEKQQRISEVLLGSVSPFTLMLGKLLGVVAVAMTVGAIYATLGYALASRYGLTETLSPGLLSWFFLFLALAVLTYASLFIAVGAAANDIKETQSLLMPVMLLAATPMLLLPAVLQNSNGIVAMVGSFFPFTAPMIMTARISVPPGVPWWQPLCAIGLVLPTVLACVWAASRIFRVGLLMQGKGVKLHDLARWVIRG